MRAPILAVSTLLAVSLAGASRDALAQPHRLDPAVANDLVLSDVVGGFDLPTAAEYLPDGKLIILEQRTGNIKVWTGTGEPTIAGTMPVDVVAGGGGERGLLGLAVDPQFATTHRLYFYYSEAGSTAEDRNHVAWATFDPMNSTVDVAGRHVILTGIHGPANHNGGGLTFGPDGFLYIGAGDTGCNCGCAPGTNTNNYYSTCLTNLNGKIMRIDRDGVVPSANPLSSMPQVAACGTAVDCSADGQAHAPDPQMTDAASPQIYVWGLRNPWRFSFDPMTGFLWIGDVGEVTWEEITISKHGGEHHGWPYREGAHGLDPSTCPMVTPAAPDPCIDPILEYNHSETPASGNGSITGGIFSTHCSWPEAYRGRYWFGDYSKNRVWTVTPNMARDGVVDGNMGRTVIATGGAESPVHFFYGLDGSINFVSVVDGTIHKLAPQNPAACPVDAGVPEVGGSDAGGGADAAAGTEVGPGNGDGGSTGASDAGGTAASDASGDTGRDGGGTIGGADAGGGGAKSGCSCDAARSYPRGGLEAWLPIAALALLLPCARRRRWRRGG
jgi:glucose/arabinose dehydrogenase